MSRRGTHEERESRSSTKQKGVNKIIDDAKRKLEQRNRGGDQPDSNETGRGQLDTTRCSSQDARSQTSPRARYDSNRRNELYEQRGSPRHSLQDERNVPSPRARHNPDRNQRERDEDREDRKMSPEERKDYRAQEAQKYYADDYLHENLPGEDQARGNIHAALSPRSDQQGTRPPDQSKNQIDFSMFDDDFDPTTFGISSSEEERSADETRESRRRKKKESKNSHKDSSTPIEDLKSKRDQLIVKLKEIKKQDRRTSYGTGKGTTKKKLEEEIEYYNGIIQKRDEES